MPLRLKRLAADRRVFSFGITLGIHSARTTILILPGLELQLLLWFLSNFHDKNSTGVGKKVLVKALNFNCTAKNSLLMHLPKLKRELEA